MIKNEFELKKWFEKNYKSLGYTKIVKKDDGTFPDFIMLRNDKKVRVELETMLSNFNVHKHNLNDVDEIICIKKDTNLNKAVITISELDFRPRRRTSFSVSEETIEKINYLMKKDKGKYRNVSHLLERAIARLAEEYK